MAKLIFALDNTEYSINGDFYPSRAQSQHNSILSIFSSLSRADPKTAFSLTHQFNGQVFPLCHFSSSFSSVGDSLQRVRQSGRFQDLEKILDYVNLMRKASPCVNSLDINAIFICSPIKLPRSNPPQSRSAEVAGGEGGSVKNAAEGEDREKGGRTRAKETPNQLYVINFGNKTLVQENEMLLKEYFKTDRDVNVLSVSSEEQGEELEFGERVAGFLGVSVGLPGEEAEMGGEFDPELEIAIKNSLVEK